MQSLEKEVRTAVNSIHEELMGTGTDGPASQQSGKPQQASERKENSAAIIKEGDSTKERRDAQEGEERKQEIQTRGKLLQFAGKRFGRGEAKCLKRFGGPDRDRTDDLFHAMEARSQLRHRPTLEGKSIVVYPVRFVNLA